MLYIKRIIITLLFTFIYAVNTSAASSNPSALTDEQLSAVMVIINNFILSDDTSSTPSKEELAIEKILKYADNSNDVPTVQDYLDAGITGVTSSNLSTVNQAVKNTSVDTSTEIQTLVDTIIGEASPPVITLNGEKNMTLLQGTTYSEAGATAVNSIGGTVSVTITGHVDSNTLGSYTITYTATDAAGNTATETRTVTVTQAPDTTKPTITLLGQASVALTVGDKYTDAGATASDDRDGDITANIQTTSTVDINTAGTYTVTYNVSDAAGNTADSVTRTVVVTQSDAIRVVDENFTIDVAKVDGYNADDPIEKQYLAVVNYLRGLRIKCNDPAALEGPVGSDLVWNTLLTDASKEHSDDMLITGQFTHEGSGEQSDITGQTFSPTRASTPFERMTHHGYTYSTAGENIDTRAAYPELADDSWVRAMEDWMKSHTGHCSNIMDPNFRDFGMAESRGTKPIVFSDGITRDVPVAYWTQNFGSP